MKKLVLLSALMVTFLVTNSQSLSSSSQSYAYIFFKDGLVEKVNEFFFEDMFVFYKLYEKNDKKLYKEYSNKIKKIKYEDGTVKYFSSKIQSEIESLSNSSDANSSDANSPTAAATEIKPATETQTEITKAFVLYDRFSVNRAWRAGGIVIMASGVSTLTWGAIILAQNSKYADPLLRSTGIACTVIGVSFSLTGIILTVCCSNAMKRYDVRDGIHLFASDKCNLNLSVGTQTQLVFRF